MFTLTYFKDKIAKILYQFRYFFQGGHLIVLIHVRGQKGFKSTGGNPTLIYQKISDLDDRLHFTKISDKNL